MTPQRQIAPATYPSVGARCDAAMLAWRIAAIADTMEVLLNEHSPERDLTGPMSFLIDTLQKESAELLEYLDDQTIN